MIVPDGFLSVCPIHLHFLFFISFSMGSCLVIFQSVVLGTLSVHFRCRILRRHLLMKVYILFSVFWLLRHVSRCCITNCVTSCWDNDISAWLGYRTACCTTAFFSGCILSGRLHLMGITWCDFAVVTDTIMCIVYISVLIEYYVFSALPLTKL